MTQEADHAFFPVVEVHPAETVAGKVFLVERRFGTVTAVQIAHPALQAGMQWILQDMPFQAFVVLPFAALSELPAHEQKLLAGMTPHMPVEQAQVGELLPFVARASCRSASPCRAPPRRATSAGRSFR